MDQQATRRQVFVGVRAQVVFLGLLVLAGIPAGAVWRVLVPFVLDHSDRQEASFAGEGGLAVVGAAAGLVTGLLVTFRPSPWPAARTAVAVAGSIVASVLTWITGETLGAPGLTAPGITLIWPVVTSVVIFTAAMLPILSNRMSTAAPPLPAPPAPLAGHLTDWSAKRPDQ